MAQRTLSLIAFVFVFCIGIVGGHYSKRILPVLRSALDFEQSPAASGWPDGFSTVQIQSHIDSSFQPAIFAPAQSQSIQPLIVSLHSWSNDYLENDPLAPFIKAAKWNFIHPDFRGPNRSPAACLSDEALGDIDDAIQFAINNGRVDTANIFVVGVSGGGHATLGSYLHSTHSINTFISWAPISDLTAWYLQSKVRRLQFSKDILDCTSEGGTLNMEAARDRSPLFMELPPKPNGKLEIYAGIDDGYTGSVPISHSILFYNRIIQFYGRKEDMVSNSDTIELLTRGYFHGSELGKLDDRVVIYAAENEIASLVIFDGTHEILPAYCIKRIKELIK